MWKYIAGGLLSSILFVGCFRDSGLENPDLRSVQINGVKLSSKSLPILASTFFSIDHVKGTIFNAVPLPRNTQLDSVALNLSVSERAQVVVRIGGKEIPRSVKDSVFMRNFAQGIEIEVTNPDYDGKKKIYQLQIQVYQHDPLASQWKSFTSAPSLNAYGSGVHSRIASNQEGFHYLYTQSGGSSLFFATASSPDQWALRATLPNSLVDIDACGANYLVGLTSSGGLVQIQGAQTTPIAIPEKVVALLGTYARNYEETPSVALIVEKEGSLRFADWSRGKVSYGEVVPKDFPTQDFLRVHRQIENQSVLTIFAGKSSDGKLQNKTWTTSTSLDWLTPPTPSASALPLSLGVGAVTYDPQDQILFYWAVGDKEVQTSFIEVYYSKDHGISWTKGSAADLLPAELLKTTFGRGLAGYIDNQHRMYLFGGAASHSPALYCGSPLRFR